MRTVPMSEQPGLVLDVGSMVLHVKDLDEGLRFYHDLLGFQVTDGAHRGCCHRVKIGAGASELVLLEIDDHTPLAMKCWGLDSPVQLRVSNFAQAATFLEGKGVRVERDDEHSGVVWDPSGNAIGLHDHPPGTATGKGHRSQPARRRR